MKKILLEKVKNVSLKTLPRHIKTKCPQLYQYIQKHTSFLPQSATLSERIYNIINNILLPSKCSCGNLLKFKSFTDGYSKFCSSKCANTSPITRQKIKNTCKLKYKVENVSSSIKVKEKIKQTMLKKYGIDNIFKNKKYIQEKTIEKLGVKHCMQNETIKQKQHNTMLNKYGVLFPFQIKAIKQTMQTKYFDKMYSEILSFKNVEPLFSRAEYIGSYIEYQWKCKKCGNIFYSNISNGNRPICRQCYPIQTSKYQTEILTFINTLTSVKINSRKIISPFELDCFIPNKNIAIECNGNYWHSEIGGQKIKNYHLNKTKLCEKQNIQLIHIFEDEWLYKQKIIKTKIKYLINNIKYKIYAKNCIIKQITPQIKTKFLNKYHIQNDTISHINLGAFYKNRLIAVMTFGKLRKALGNSSQNNNWELIRYATIANFLCIGVAGKLLNFFEKTYKPSKIITYADRRWSQGNLYYKLNFKLDHISPPNYWYISVKNYLNKFHRFNFRKNVLKDKLKVFDPNLSEWKNMKNNGYDRIWDCGNLVFKKDY